MKKNFSCDLQTSSEWEVEIGYKLWGLGEKVKSEDKKWGNIILLIVEWTDRCKLLKKESLRRQLD